MIRTGSSRLLRSVSFACLALALFGSAHDAAAQNPPRKVPGGPWVIPNNPLNGIEPGPNRFIEWNVTLTNTNPLPGVFAFVDGPQGNGLPANPGGQLECEPGGQGGGAEQPGTQDALFFPDADGDGQCEPRAVVIDAGGTPIPATVTCDNATQILEIRDINVPGFTTVSITFVTEVSDRAPVGGQVCNWGHLYAPEPGGPPNQRTDTFPYTPGFTAGCSCLMVGPRSGFDLQTTKTAAITAPGGRLIPGDRDATVQYTITLTNTGGGDITGGRMLDVVGGATLAEGRGLEWVSLDSFSPGITCTIDPSNTRLDCTNINIPSADPDESIVIVATARVTCAAATDTDNGRVCNQGIITVPGQPGSFGTDDPSAPLLEDPTCLDVVWSNLTTSQKFVDDFVDANGNNQLDVGERINFRIRARNAGTFAASGVVVTDDVGATGCLDPATITALDSGVVAGGVITWDAGDLAPLGGSRDVRFSAVLTQDTLCCNQGSLQSTEREGCGQGPILTDDDAVSEDPVVTPANPTCASPGPQPDLVFEKSAQNVNDINGNGQFDSGDRIRWTITIENNGLGAATDVSLTDPLSPCNRSFAGPGGVTITSSAGGAAGDAACSVPYAPPANPGSVCATGLGGADGIMPGETVTLTFEANLSGNNLAFCCNQAHLTYAERSGEIDSDDVATPGLVDDTTCLQAPPCEPTGRLEKRIDLIDDLDLDGRAEVGEEVDYILTFTNVGCGNLTNIRIQDLSSACLALDTAPGAIEIAPVGSGTNSSAGGTVDILFAGPLAPTESVTILLTAVSLAAGPNCCNQATWTATEVPAGGLSDYNTADFSPEQPTCSDWLAQDAGTGDPDLQVSKTVAEAGCQDPGGTVNYTITIANAGAGPASSFTLTDVLPAGLTNVVVDPPLTYDAGTNTVSLSGGPLAVRDSLVLKFSATLPCAASGTVSNTALVSYSDSTGTVDRSASVDVSFGLPVLSTSSKTATPNPGADGVLGPGDTVTYSIRVTNSGTCAARGVVVTDQFEAFWNVAGATIGQGGVASPADTVRWDDTTTAALSSIAPGAFVDLTVTVPVAAGFTTETRDANTVPIVAAGHPPACGSGSPSASASSPEVCLNCAVVADQQDLLVKAAPGPTLPVILPSDQLGTAVFDNVTPNTGSCGETKLDITQDVVQTDVAATLATGVPVSAAQAQGVLVFFEVSNRCDAEEGAPADQPIIVRKAPGGNYVVTLVP